MRQTCCCPGTGACPERVARLAQHAKANDHGDSSPGCTPYRGRTWMVPLCLSREALHEVRQLIYHLRVTAEHNNIGIRRTSVADPGEAARDEAQGVQTRKD